MATKKKPLDQLKLKRWAARGKGLKVDEYRLRKMEVAHQWNIAEWMLEGETSFGREAARDTAEKATGMTRETLRQFAYTARNVKVSTRVNGLSFGHHRGRDGERTDGSQEQQ